MKLKELKEAINFKISDLEHFKTVVIEAVESTCHWKKYGAWLHEDYAKCPGKDNQYRATIIVMNECYNKDTKVFRVDHKNIMSVTIYDIFYTDTTGGAFVIDDINLYYDAIKAFEKLLK